MNDLFAPVLDLIADGDLRLAGQLALDIVRRESVGRSVEETALVSWLGELTRLEQEQLAGTITRAEAKTELAQLGNRLVGLVDRWAQRFGIAFDAPPSKSTREVLTGAMSHLVSIEWLRRGLALADSVCRIASGRLVGSGFLVAGGRVVTNHHVLPSREHAERARVWFDFERGTEPTGEGLRIAAGSWRSVPSVDCAVVTLDGDVSRIAALPLEKRTVLAGDHVSIIQHPEGGPKQIAVTANEVVTLRGDRVLYSTDTMPGSSGSPVFDDDWQIVALHRAGGNTVKNAAGETVFANEGIAITRVIDELGLR